MWMVVMYKRGRSLFWDGHEWSSDRANAHLWADKTDAEKFAAKVQGPWEAVVHESE